MALLVNLQPRAIGARARQRLVSELVQDGERSASAVYESLADRGVVNASTGKPFSMSTIRNDIQAATAKVSVTREIIGRTTTTSPIWKWRAKGSVDATQADYLFWDNLRRGKANGFAFGALFCMPLTQIISSFVFGDGIQVEIADKDQGSKTKQEYTNDLLSKLVARMHHRFLTLAADLYGLGDQYLAVNPDATVSLISPDLVELEWDDLDYRKITSMTMTAQLEKHTVEDVYTPQGRTTTIRQAGGTSGKPGLMTAEFDNLIGRLPVVHFANDQGTNEIYGRPIYEALYRLFSRYDDLIEKALDGAEIMGNPMPTFEGMENIAETIDANSAVDTESYTDVDGNADTRTLINWDRLGVLWIGKGGHFEFKAPPTGFTNDIRAMLKSLFLLILDYTRVPEAVWGGAIASSKASAEVQMPPFLQYIQGRRVALEGIGADEGIGSEAKGGLYEFFDVWLRTKGLTDPRVLVAPVTIRWPELDTKNWEVLLNWVQYLRGTGVMDSETALTLFGEVDDPTAVIAAAEKEADDAAEKERQQALEQQPTGQRFPQALDQAEREAAQQPPDEDEAEALPQAA